MKRKKRTESLRKYLFWWFYVQGLFLGFRDIRWVTSNLVPRYPPRRRSVQMPCWLQRSTNKDREHKTRYTRYNMLLKSWHSSSLSVPPTPPLIYDVHDIQLSSVVGPFHIGDNLTLKCRVRGGDYIVMQRSQSFIFSFPGKPLPRVSWMRDKITMNSSSQVIVRRIIMS